MNVCVFMYSAIIPCFDYVIDEWSVSYICWYMICLESVRIDLDEFWMNFFFK